MESDELEVELRAKRIFERQHLKDRVWGDLAVARKPGGNTQISLNDEEREVFLEQARKELHSET